MTRIKYTGLTKVRRDLENIFMLIEELESKGIEVPKDLLLRSLNGAGGFIKEDDNPGKDESSRAGNGSRHARDND